jgi:hypothetical protein
MNIGDAKRFFIRLGSAKLASDVKSDAINMSSLKSGFHELELSTKQTNKIRCCSALPSRGRSNKTAICYAKLSTHLKADLEARNSGGPVIAKRDFHTATIITASARRFRSASQVSKVFEF